MQTALVRERRQPDVGLVGARRLVRDLSNDMAHSTEVNDAIVGKHSPSELQFEICNDRHEIRIAATLAVSVDDALHVRDAGLDRGERIRDCAAGVVVRVDAKASATAFQHRVDDVGELRGQHPAVRVTEHDHVSSGFGRDAYRFDCVGRIRLVAVEEMLGVDEDPASFTAQVLDRVADHREVLVERGLQCLEHVPVVTLGDEAHDGRFGISQRRHLRVVGGLHVRLAGRTERTERCVLELQLGAGAAEELGVLRQCARPTAFNETDAEVVEVLRNRQFVGDREGHALTLGAVAQGRVVDVKGIGLRSHRVTSTSSEVLRILRPGTNKKTPRTSGRSGALVCSDRRAYSIIAAE